MSISKALQKKIISELSSASLRKEIEKRGKAFSEKELLAVVCKYCKRMSRRKELLDGLKEEAEADVSELAARYAAYEEKLLKDFSMPVRDAVYQVRIRERENWESCYLAKTFEGARKVLVLYVNDFGEAPVNVSIEKKYCRDFSIPEELDDDCLGCCELDSDFEILRIRRYSEDEQSEIERLIGDTEIAFPVFYKDYDIVKYVEDGKTGYGFTLLPEGGEAGAEAAYVISFDTEAAANYAFDLPPVGERNKDFPTELDYVVFNAHEHIPLPGLESGSYEELPEKLKRIYTKLTSGLKDGNGEK